MVKALYDGVITPEEATEVNELLRKIGLSGEQQRAAHVRAMNSFVRQVLQDGIVTEREASQIELLCKQLKVTSADIDYQSAKELQSVLYIQQAMQGVLPVRDADSSPMALKAGENLHLVATAYTTSTRSIGSQSIYGGPSVRIRVARGISLGFGGGTIRTKPVKQLVVSGTGPLVLTSQRCSYMGTTKAFHMPWDKVANIESEGGILTFHFTSRQNASVIVLDDGSEAGKVAAAAHVLMNR